MPRSKEKYLIGSAKEEQRKKERYISEDTDSDLKHQRYYHATFDEDEFTTLDIPPPEPIIKPFIFRGDYTGMVSRRSVGKSNLAMLIAYLATRPAGSMSLGPFTCQTPVNTLFIDAEQSPRQLLNRHERFKVNVPKPEKSLSFTPNFTGVD
jgi:hypothetical protein